MAKKPAKAKPADDEEEIDEEQEESTEEKQLPLPVPAEVSAPAKASCLTFIFLAAAVVITLGVSWLTTGKLLGTTMSPWWFVAIVVLVFVIPVVVYRAVSLWLYDEVSRFPDIAAAWRAGIVELQRHGIAIRSAPLFLIIGTGNDRLRRNFMNAAESEFLVEGAAGAGAPLNWYVNADGIFLYLDDASWMNAAVSLYEIHAAAAKGGRALPGDAPAKSAGRPAPQRLGTIMPDIRPSMIPQQVRHADVPSTAPGASDNPANAGPPDKQSGPPRGGVSSANYAGTLMPDQIAGPSASADTSPAQAAVPTMRAGQRVSIRLTSEQSSLQLQRLENVCGLLRKYRHPLCPANGMLALLPFEMLKAGPQDVAELERAIAADMSTIYRELQLRCPVTAVVVGMEQERGFRELVRRIGHEGAVKQRFGQRFDIRSLATVDELRKFTSHLCGTFEDWVYTLFREEEALSHPGNTALYALLCKVRKTLKNRLGEILGKGFGYSPGNDAPPVLFSGCYFAATGPKADRQAFVGGLLSKLYDEQEEIEWTDDALRDNHRRRWLIIIGWVLCGAVLLSAAIYQVVRQ